MRVPFFRYPHVFEQHREGVLDALVRASESGAYIMQRDLEEFEGRLAEYCGVKFAVGVGNATDGLELNLKVAGVGPGDGVLLASHTFVATASAIVALGAHPVFVEIGEDHLLDPDDIEQRITERTRAIMPTQLNGRSAKMDQIRAIAEQHRLKIVEDSAQGLGSLYRGRMAGTFGVAGVYSFYPAKTLGALGDGGAVVTDDENVACEIRELRDHGRDPKTGEVNRWGRNTRLDNIQAAVLLVKLADIDLEISRRRSIASRYQEALCDLDAIRLPPAPKNDGEHFDVFQNYEIEADDRNSLRQFLDERGVGTALQWGGKGVHQFPKLGIEQSLPRTEAIMDRSLLLPMNTSLTDEEADHVAHQILEFYER